MWFVLPVALSLVLVLEQAPAVSRAQAPPSSSKVWIGRHAEFEDFLRHRLTRIAGVAQVTTSFALRPVVYKTALPVAG